MRMASLEPHTPERSEFCGAVGPSPHPAKLAAHVINSRNEAVRMVCQTAGRIVTRPAIGGQMGGWEAYEDATPVSRQQSVRMRKSHFERADMPRPLIRPSATFSP